jgi:transposase InsO family protein
MIGEIRMKQKELDRITILEDIKKKKLTQRYAAEILTLSPRQVNRLYKKYLKEGPRALIHKSRGKSSNRKTSEEQKTQIIALVKVHYTNFGPTLIAEKLQENHAITIDHETIRRLLIKHNVWQKNARKIKKHFWRERKHHTGEMVQVDGSFHSWFGSEYSTLIAFIDDATSAVMAAKFVQHETTKDLAEITQEYLKNHGRPWALYTDRGKVYKVNKAKDPKAHRTQYQRMLEELDIKLIHAYSPQAKGRIERLFKTLQDRLVKELRLNNVKTIEAANQLLKEYLPKHNEKFACVPQQSADVHRSVEGYDLKSIFCLKQTRKLNKDYTITFTDKIMLLDKKQEVILKPGDSITVHLGFDGTILLKAKNKRLEFRFIVKQDRIKKPKERVYKNRVFKPKHNHPWRTKEKSDISIELRK